MGRIQLEAVGLEFEEHGNTIWVQGAQGTLLRIKCSGHIKVKRCEAPGAHADVLVSGDIEFCVPGGPVRSGGAKAVDRRGRRAPAAIGVVQAVGRRAGAVPAAQISVRGTGRRIGRALRSGGRGQP